MAGEHNYHFALFVCGNPADDPAKLQVFNPDCYLIQLVQDIRKESTARGNLGKLPASCLVHSIDNVASLFIPDEILLLDKDNNLINLTKHMAEDPLQNASQLFRMRGEYLLLTVES